MNEFEVLELLENTGSKTAKIKILKDNLHLKNLAFMLDAALNFNRKFHIKQFNENVSLTSIGESDIDFVELLRQLEAREITGNEAIAVTEKFFGYCDALQRKWYARVIRKNLRAGVDSTVRKAGFNIPKFEVMLAKDANLCKKLKEIVEGGVFISPKLDGYRCIAVCDNGSVSLYSRNGSIYSNFPTIIETLERVSEGMSYVLDGEIMSDDFSSMQKTAFASQRRTSVGDVNYHVFGYIEYNEWITGNFVMSTTERVNELDHLFEDLVMNIDDNIIQVDQIHATDVATCRKYETEFIQEGYEGAMVLPDDIPYYKGKKSNKLLKFKIMKSMECVVVGMYEGNDKYKGMMGGLNLHQDDGKECDVGSGFTDEDRDYVWKNKDKILGRLVEIKYQELTDDGIMRFPIFLRYRDSGAGSGKK